MPMVGEVPGGPSAASLLPPALRGAGGGSHFGVPSVAASEPTGAPAVEEKPCVPGDEGGHGAGLCGAQEERTCQTSAPRGPILPGPSKACGGSLVGSQGTPEAGFPGSLLSRRYCFQRKLSATAWPEEVELGRSSPKVTALPHFREGALVPPGDSSWMTPSLRASVWARWPSGLDALPQPGRAESHDAHPGRPWALGKGTSWLLASTPASCRI